MRNLLCLIALTVLTFSCGKKEVTKVETIYQDKVLPQSMTLTYEGTDSRLTGLTITVNLKDLNKKINVGELFDTPICLFTHGYDNTVTIESIDNGRSGSIRFDALEYGGNDNPNRDEACRAFNKEVYTFNYDGEMMVMSVIAPNKSWDRLLTVFVAN